MSDIPLNELATLKKWQDDALDLLMFILSLGDYAGGVDIREEKEMARILIDQTGPREQAPDRPQELEAENNTKK